MSLSEKLRLISFLVGWGCQSEPRKKESPNSESILLRQNFSIFFFIFFFGWRSVVHVREQGKVNHKLVFDFFFAEEECS